MLGLIYFGIFFLFEIEAPTHQKVLKLSENIIYLKKPLVSLDQYKNDIIKYWGEPASYIDSDKKDLIYFTKDSTIFLSFDYENRLDKIVMDKRK